MLNRLADPAEKLLKGIGRVGAGATAAYGIIEGAKEASEECEAQCNECDK
jgi:hypothetical protein